MRWRRNPFPLFAALVLVCTSSPIWLFVSFYDQSSTHSPLVKKTREFVPGFDIKLDIPSCTRESTRKSVEAVIFAPQKIMTILRNDMIQNWPFTGKMAQLTWILLDEKQLIDMKITWLSAGYKTWEHVVLVRLVCNTVRRNVSLVSILLYFSFLNAVQISKFLKY